ncbi:MAG: BTAD domain-containing putative transcriptional regulator [Micromonosporaceae bacterium]
MIEVRLLGPFEVAANGRPVTVPRGRVRILLAALALAEGRPVSVDTLVDYLWQDHGAPPTVRQALHNTVWRLRQVLGSGAVGAEGDSYVLDTGPDAVDAVRFSRLIDAAAAADGRGEPPDAVRALLTEAQRLWRGAPLVGVDSETLRRDVVPALTEQYVAAVERRIDIDLAAGRHDGLIAELRGLTAAYPLRESLWTRLLTALAGSGRTAEALESYDKVRRLLADQLGADPCEELRQVHHKILVGEPTGPPAQRRDREAPAKLPAPKSGGTVTASGSVDVSDAGSIPGGLPAAAGTPPRQLPSDTSDFVGRAEELRTLDRILAEHAAGHPSDPRPVLTVVIHGVGGVGKTALALHWAHTAADQFPDGQLHLDLHGYGPGDPVTAPAALSALLHTLGVQDRAIPVAVDERAALLRTMMAGRRVLLVLDNARSADQIRPLLPGADSVVVVTSRGQLRGLSSRDGAKSLLLRQMSDPDAAGLLAATIGTGRVAAQPAAAEELAALCGRLPLALRITADLASRHPDLPLADLAADLRAERLDTLADVDDPAADPRAVFSWSYRALSADDARLLRICSLMPGNDFGVPATAALLDAPVGQTRRALDRLVAVHLLEPGRIGRYQFHDLVRVYAAERAEDSAQVRDSAVRRLLQWTLQTAEAASEAVRPGLEYLTPRARPTIEPVIKFSDAVAALDWYDAERELVNAGASRAAELGDHETAWRLASVVFSGFVLNRPQWDEWLAMCEGALASARQITDPAAEGAILVGIGNVRSFLGADDEAQRCYGRAVELFRKAGTRPQEGMALALIASSQEAQGHHRKALRFFEQSVSIARELGDETREAHALNNMAITYLSLGRIQDSMRASLRSLEVRRAIGDRRSTAYALDNLGDAYTQTGEHAKAVECYREALEIAREHKDRRSEGIYLGNLACAELHGGEPEQARRTAVQAWLALAGLPDAEAAKFRARVRQAFPDIGD